MVFLSELPRPRPLETRHKYAIAMAAVLATATGFVVVFPRSATVAGWLAVCAALILTWADGRDTSRPKQPLFRSHIVIAAGALALWMLASSIWSANPEAARVVPYVASLLVLLALAAGRIARVARHEILFIVESAWVVFAAATAVVFIDLVTQQTWKVALVSKFGYAIDEAFTPRFIQRTAQGDLVLSTDILSRSGFAIALLVWPMLLTARSILSRRYRTAASIVLATFSAATVFSLPQDAAKLAMVSGAVTFAIAWFFPRASIALAVTAWIFASLLAAPIAKLPFTMGAASDPQFPYSYRERVLIWNTIADASERAPIAGQGGAATATLAQHGQLSYHIERPGQPAPADHAHARQQSPSHPHNGFLEVRFELGLIGSLLLAIAGAITLRALSGLANDAVAFALATVAAWAAVFSMSFSLWSTSFAGALALVILVTLFALRAHVTRPADP